MRSLYSLD